MSMKLPNRAVSFNLILHHILDDNNDRIAVSLHDLTFHRCLTLLRREASCNSTFASTCLQPVAGEYLSTMMRSISFAAVMLLIISTPTDAVKDSAWHNGIETPNVALPMYWGDMPNIIEDLGNFTNLYVKYHSCAWSQLGGYGDQENTGKDVEEDEYW
jgi:hypothetical protein